MKRIILLEIIVILLISTKTQDFSFYYDNIKDNIYLSLENNNTTQTQSYSASTLLDSNNLNKRYSSLAGSNKFNIEYYSCNISSMPLDLIKVEYNLTDYENSLIKEVILNLDNSNENIFPSKYKDEFTVEQNKTASNEGSTKRETLIYDTYGFNIKSKHDLNFKVSKILLANFQRKRLNYLANLSYNIRQHNGNNSFDIYLKDMPEDFDLLITLDLCDENWKETGQKILIVKKEINYPNFKVEDENPNNTMIIISITFIILAFILIIIFVLLKLIFGFF